MKKNKRKILSIDKKEIQRQIFHDCFDEKS